MYLRAYAPSMDRGEPDQKRTCLKASESHSWSALLHPAASQYPQPSPCLYQHQPYTPRTVESPLSHPLPPAPPPSAPHANDRRHHAQKPYMPELDHHRQCPSPAYLDNVSFSSDTGIEREKSEDPIWHARRPGPTGGQPTADSPANHSMLGPRQPPTPHQCQDEPQRHASFDSSQRLPPALQPTPPLHPPYPSPPCPQAGDPLHSLDADAKSQKRKSIRVSQVWIMSPWAERNDL